MFRPETIIEKKSALFGVVVLVVVGTLMVPVILPHFYHGLHVIHISLHIGGLVLACFLASIANIAFIRLKTKRLLFTAIAFSMFIVAECVLLVEATWPAMFEIYTLSLLEVGHILTIGTLGLLALGVLRND